jgi:hypothetical protein
MPTVDGEHREILFQVAVIGGVSQRFTEQLDLRNSELQLGEVQGYRPRFAFAIFQADPWEGDSTKGRDLERLVPYLDGLVLNDALSEGTHYSSTALERLSRALSPGKLNVPTAIFGGPALAQEWQSLSGTAPVIAVEPAEEQAMLCVRALTKALLRSKMKSQPPPPALDA